MNKQEFIAAYAARRGRDLKDARRDVTAFLDQITQSLVDGERITFKRHFSLHTYERAASTAHPFGGPPVEVPAHVVVKFRPGTGLRAAVQASLHSGRQEAA
ncbi:HU family DNA-binding protein [Nonomuraea sp. LPB2021202275-12-8]|uniref:HU family DNA-binding protein n=1 Tax=Nonomuraea sp. LPB2021202275-12-8 TaxID=3120159 RepID=UPI00300CF681